jgi:hypothetical protein
MNSPFILTSNNNKIFTVSWPTYNDIRETELKLKLLELLFNKFNTPDVGLVIEFNNEEVDIMWINEFAYVLHPEIDQYMYDHYKIVGVAFEDLSKAELLKDWLEKKLVWKILNT